MRLRSIRVHNFKTFGDLDIQLDDLNVVVGANASGKSNLVQLFAFLRDLAESGLENAISIHGGPQYLRNVNCEPDSLVTIELKAISESDDPIVTLAPDEVEGRVIGCSYRFSVGFSATGSPIIRKDELQAEWCAVKDSAKVRSFIITRGPNQNYELVDPKDPLGTFFLRFLQPSLTSQSELGALLIERQIPRSVLPLDGLRSIAILDIDSKGPKVGVIHGGKSDLETDGGNLAIVLRKILSDPESRRKLFNLLTDLLPFVRTVDTESFSDNSLLFKVHERFSESAIPASFLSDGTVDIIGLIAILYFDRRRFVIIEEPERNIHPSLISRIVELLKDASHSKQIVVTTHSPEIVRYVQPSQLILISRDSSGFSHAERPASKEQVKRFLRDEITMEELYVQNLLEV